MKRYILRKLAEYINRLLRYYQSFKIQQLINKGLLIVGKQTYGINNLDIHVYQGSQAKVIIGKYCSIGPSVTIITGGIHPTDWVSTYPFRAKLNLKGKFEDGMPFTKGDIIIGNDVWIGTGVEILSGVTIEHGAVIATGSIVTKNVPPYAVVAGNPARIIRFRFEEEQIKHLLDLKWWDWDDERIINSIDLISSNRISEFIENNRQT